MQKCVCCGRGLNVNCPSEVSDGLCCTLGEPCYIVGSNNVPVVTGPPPVAVKRPTINWKDVDRCVKCVRSQIKWLSTDHPSWKCTHPQVVPILFICLTQKMIFWTMLVTKQLLVAVDFITFLKIYFVFNKRKKFMFGTTCSKWRQNWHFWWTIFNDTLVIWSFQKLVDKFLNKFSWQLHDLRPEKGRCRGLYSERRPEGGH